MSRWMHPRVLFAVLRSRAPFRSIAVLPLAQVGRYGLVLIRERPGSTDWPDPVRLRPVHFLGCPRAAECRCGVGAAHGEQS